MPRVLVLTSLAPHLAHLLTASAPAEYTIDIQPIALPDAAKIELIGDADFLVLFPGVISEAVLRASRRLKLIQLVSAGFDRMDLKLCLALGIPVANNGGTNAIDVAEHALMLILAYYRRLREMDANVRARTMERDRLGCVHLRAAWKDRGNCGLRQDRSAGCAPTAAVWRAHTLC